MATHGAARQATINALSAREPFRRSGFAMSAQTGAPSGTGRLEGVDLDTFKRDCDGPGIAYTVMSYQTPIAWVTTDGTVRIPDTRYSATTTGHQSLCRAYL